MMGMPFMSSSKGFFCLVLLLLSSPHLSQAGQPKPVQVLVCPASITVDESVLPPLGWRSSSEGLVRRFERISIYQVSPKGKELDLAPDGQKRSGGNISQVWYLPKNRSVPTFLRCRYRDTSVTLQTEISSTIQECDLHYLGDAHGLVKGPSDGQCM
jgi:hypothetical protein